MKTVRVWVYPNHVYKYYEEASVVNRLRMFYNDTAAVKGLEHLAQPNLHAPEQPRHFSLLLADSCGDSCRLLAIRSISRPVQTLARPPHFNSPRLACEGVGPPWYSCLKHGFVGTLDSSPTMVLGWLRVCYTNRGARTEETIHWRLWGTACGSRARLCPIGRHATTNLPFQEEDSRWAGGACFFRVGSKDCIDLARRR